MSAIEKHVHEYERSQSNKKIYRCISPDCAHYQQREFLVGKRAVCHKCKRFFILTWRKLRAKRPICDYCVASPQAAEFRAVRIAAETLFKEQLSEEIKAVILDNTLE